MTRIILTIALCALTIAGCAGQIQVQGPRIAQASTTTTTTTTAVVEDPPPTIVYVRVIEAGVCTYPIPNPVQRSDDRAPDEVAP